MFSTGSISKDTIPFLGGHTINESLCAKRRRVSFLYVYPNKTPIKARFTPIEWGSKLCFMGVTKLKTHFLYLGGYITKESRCAQRHRVSFYICTFA